MIIPEENKKMFNSIAGGYDKTNDLITLGQHKSWYKLMVKLSRLDDNSSVLDCATGTGNVAIAFKSHFGKKLKVCGIDVAENMLDVARKKSNDLNMEIEYIKGDILNMPFANDTFDLATISFGIRNTRSIEDCLTEMARVVKSGGKVMILETGRIRGLKRVLFSLYQKFAVRTIGSVLTGNKSAYDFLVDSSNNFPSGREFIGIMQQTAVFQHTEFRKKMFGTIFLYIGLVK